MLIKLYLSTTSLTLFLLVSNANASNDAEVNEKRVSAQLSKEIDTTEFNASAIAAEARAKINLDVEHYSTPVEILNALNANKKITSLNLIYTMCTDQVITLLPKYCANLTTLKLGFTEITDLGVASLAQNYPNLVALDLTANAITNASLVSIAKYCMSLEWLSLAGNVQVTDDGIRHLMESCKHIKYLKLLGSGASNAFLKELQAGYPNLEIDGFNKPAAKQSNKAASKQKKNTSSKKKKGAHKSKKKNSNKKKTQQGIPNKVEEITLAKQPALSDSSSNQTLTKNIKGQEKDFKGTLERAMLELEYGRFDEGLYFYEKALNMIDPKHPFYEECKSGYEQVKKIINSAGKK